MLTVWGCKLRRKHLLIRALSTREEWNCDIRVMEEIWVPILTVVQGSYMLNLSWSWSLTRSKINPQTFSWAVQSQCSCPLDCFHGLDLREAWPKTQTVNTYSLVCLPKHSQQVSFETSKGARDSTTGLADLMGSLWEHMLFCSGSWGPCGISDESGW